MLWIRNKGLFAVLYFFSRNRFSTVLLTRKMSTTSNAQDSPVLFEVKNNIGLITLNRPKALNALNLPMIQAKSLYISHVVRSVDSDMSFWCLQFSQKTNLKTQIFALAYLLGQKFFVRFWENWKKQNVLSKLTDL